jgi:hypothetical protein
VDVAGAIDQDDSFLGSSSPSDVASPLQPVAISPPSGQVKEQFDFTVPRRSLRPLSDPFSSNTSPRRHNVPSSRFRSRSSAGPYVSPEVMARKPHSQPSRDSMGDSQPSTQLNPPSQPYCTESPLPPSPAAYPSTQHWGVFPDLYSIQTPDFTGITVGPHIVGVPAGPDAWGEIYSDVGAAPQKYPVSGYSSPAFPTSSPPSPVMQRSVSAEYVPSRGCTSAVFPPQRPSDRGLTSMQSLPAFHERHDHLHLYLSKYPQI